MNQHRKTKIVATIGPASSAPEKLRELIREGMDVARLNLSHGDHASHRELFRRVRAAAKAENRTVAIVADLQGPKMRVGILPKEGVVLADGARVVLDTRAAAYRPGFVPLPSPAFTAGTRAGHAIFLDDGTISLLVKSVRGGVFTCKVLQGGTLFSNKGVNVPQLALRRSILEKKDRADLAFAVREGADYLALSFIRNGKDIDVARRLLGRSPVKLIAKIERPEALEHLDEIIARVDAVMVARGDLGIETPLWALPVRQKEIVDRVRAAMKPVIVATQMLQSMTQNPIPTRAEVSDVANAVYDSADAVMLSGESASGRYPAESVRMMRKILEETEAHVRPRRVMGDAESLAVDLSVTRAAKYIATEVGAKAILVGTVSGGTARAMSHWRPRASIVALAANDAVARSLALVWGVRPVVISSARTISELSAEAVRFLKKNKALAKGDRAVFLSGKAVGKVGQTDSLSVIVVS